MQALGAERSARSRTHARLTGRSRTRLPSAPILKHQFHVSGDTFKALWGSMFLARCGESAALNSPDQPPIALLSVVVSDHEQGVDDPWRPAEQRQRDAQQRLKWLAAQENGQRGQYHGDQIQHVSELLQECCESTRL